MLSKFKSFAFVGCLLGLLAYEVLASDLVVTGSNVKASATSNGTRVTYNGVAGQSISAGQGLYLTGSNTLMLLSATMPYTIVGISLNAAAPGQPVSYVTFDPKFVLGAAINAVDVIAVSGTGAGTITEFSNVSGTTGLYITVIGVGTLTGSIGTATIYLNPMTSGTTNP